MNKLTVLAIICLPLLTACPLDDDKDESSAESGSMWYIDADSDGYGDENDVGTASTNQPSGYVASNNDCNDDALTGAAINPDATELNTDEIDSDCDGALSKSPFIVGDYGPAGGVVFSTDGTNGLEVAPVDQDDGSGAKWGCEGVEIDGANGTVIGAGAQNTIDMLADDDLVNCPLGLHIAVKQVEAYSLNDYDDWFLPSYDELSQLIFGMSVDLGLDTSGDQYWSSTEDSIDDALTADPTAANVIENGKNNSQSKESLMRVRAVRAF